jgi:hypothetical protein
MSDVLVGKTWTGGILLMVIKSVYDLIGAFGIICGNHLFAIGTGTQERLHLLIVDCGRPARRGSGPTAPWDRGMRAGANGLDHAGMVTPNE